MYVFSLGLIPQGICPSQHGTALPSVIVSGLSQAREVRQTRDQETSCRQNEDSGHFKAEGPGSITPFFHSPRVLPWAFIPGDQSLSQVDPPVRILTHHWLTGFPCLSLSQNIFNFPSFTSFVFQQHIILGPVLPILVIQITQILSYDCCSSIIANNSCSI